MIANLSVQLEITDDYFENDKEKKLFYTSTSKQQNIWLKQKFIDCLYDISDWETFEIKINSFKL